MFAYVFAFVTKAQKPFTLKKMVLKMSQLFMSPSRYLSLKVYGSSLNNFELLAYILEPSKVIGVQSCHFSSFGRNLI